MIRTAYVCLARSVSVISFMSSSTRLGMGRLASNHGCGTAVAAAAHAKMTNMLFLNCDPTMPLHHSSQEIVVLQEMQLRAGVCPTRRTLGIVFIDSSFEAHLAPAAFLK